MVENAPCIVSVGTILSIFLSEDVFSVIQPEHDRIMPILGTAIIVIESGIGADPIIRVIGFVVDVIRHFLRLIQIRDLMLRSPVHGYHVIL